MDGSWLKWHYILITPTNSGNSGSFLIKHSNSLRQQKLGLWNNSEDAQDVKGITHCVAPRGRHRKIITISQHHKSLNNLKWELFFL